MAEAEQAKAWKVTLQRCATQSVYVEAESPEQAGEIARGQVERMGLEAEVVEVKGPWVLSPRPPELS